MTGPKKLMIFSDWFTPAFKAGGPIKSVQNLVNLIHDEYEVRIVTSDTDEGEQSPLSDVSSDKWIEKLGYTVMYLSEKKRNLRSMASLIDQERPDICYFNSLFSLKYTLIPLFLLKNNRKVDPLIVLAPRGMLGQGALAIKKNKKQLFLRASRMLGLFSDIRWHATAETERDEIYQHFGKSADIKVEANIPNDNFQNRAPIKTPGDLKLVFISRISPKKNLQFALHCLAQINVEGSIRLDIYGPVEDEEYWKKCQEEISNIPANIVVKYKGVVKPNDLDRVWENNHFLFFPTHHENFGHVIFESLSSGVPVLISDQTPWRELQQKKIGFDIPLKEELDWIHIITQILAWNNDEYMQYTAASTQFASNRYDRTTLKNQYIQLFQA